MASKVLIVFLVAAASAAFALIEHKKIKEPSLSYDSGNLGPVLKPWASSVGEIESERRQEYYVKPDASIEYVEQPGDHFAYPKYNYKYGVDDPHTGDKKFHYEERDGDVVKGQYKIVDADGYIRIVDYTSDKVNGFNAVVSRKEHRQGFQDRSEQVVPPAAS